MEPYSLLRLKPGKEALLSKLHPWVYSGALAAPPTSPLVRLADASGNVLAVGTASATNPLAVRIFRFEDGPLDAAFFRQRLDRALEGRILLGLDGPEAGCRWVFGEGDLLPGLVVDRYAHALVIQVGTAGLEALRDIWWPVLYERARAEGITVFVERSQGGRKEEGLAPVNRLLKGSLAGPVTVREGPARLAVDLLKGQKTGFFLDQREHRLFLGRISRGATVLNAFGYTGGFSIHAGLGGAARVATLDISAQALDQAQRDWEANGLDPAAHVRMEGDAFELLRALEPASFDRVVVDPPAFAKQRKDVEKAFKAYKDVFRLGARATAPGGILGCFSCSQHLDRSRFQEAVWTALLEAGREAQVLAHLGQPMDHPYALNHPEGFYLKGLWIRIF
ncbi:class I SAM-dependent rRNA methyltransferase [Mesoterricola silvestris]|uniref:Ribosomal RNA large subunit methyltransferase I n=1 Tax=Mesoterricola silvestris TaxID=2927979 RepID=A0AA48GLU2_9BACT|nr:class I SAM-dependent rRNA methyltransferase [Mesoterricola silvestris]BDU73659.1 ribosomal RNA large subunit methyltransferase I [Mesoterricola silvestris]